MNTEALRLRESCLIERAYACASGFEDIGQKFSAEFTRDLVRQIQSGLPAAIYEHWIGEQEKRLAGIKRQQIIEGDL